MFGSMELHLSVSSFQLANSQGGCPGWTRNSVSTDRNLCTLLSRYRYLCFLCQISIDNDLPFHQPYLRVVYSGLWPDFQSDFGHELSGY